MFKVNKLIDVNDEKVIIDYVTHEENWYNNGKIVSKSFKTLSFSIEGIINENEYTMSFDLNCKLEELLKIKPLKTIDFSGYLFWSETYFTINGITDMEPKVEITINRFLKNKFVILIHFYTEVLDNDRKTYSGIIEFDFDLDDYLKHIE